MTIISVTIALPVRDLEKAKAWYRQLFEYPPMIEPVPGVVELELGPAWLQLYQHQGIAGDSAVRVGVRDLHKLHKRLSEAGFVIEPISEVPGILEYFDFRDPDGNGLSFYQEFERDGSSHR